MSVNAVYVNSVAMFRFWREIATIDFKFIYGLARENRESLGEPKMAARKTGRIINENRLYLSFY